MKSWWEAALTEEEAVIGSAGARTPRSAAGSSHWDEQHMDQHPVEIVDWRHAIDLYETDQVVRLVVTNYNRGGLLVSGDSLQGFVPVSHLIEAPCQAADLDQWLASFIDRPLELKVIECDQERGRVVFSERAAQSSPGS